MAKAACTWSAVLVVLLTTGCGGAYDASVTGTVTLNSAPLAQGNVTFNPEQPGPTGYGFIDASGAYSIMTGRESGLPAGNYTVTVVANEPSVPNKNPSLPPVPGKSIVPPWYRSSSQSPLKFVVESGANEIDLQLTKEPPAGWKSAAR